MGDLATTFLKLSDDYRILTIKGERGICGIRRMAYTVGLFYGMTEDDYIGRYCYHTMGEAIDAILEWSGIGDPPGNWIKHKGGDGERSNPNYDKTENTGYEG